MNIQRTLYIYVFNNFAENSTASVTSHGTANFGTCDLQQNKEFSNGYIIKNIHFRH